MDPDDWLIPFAEAAPFWEDPFETLSATEQVFVAIWALEGDVNNGGFDQYYFNSSGDTAGFAPDALRRIGAEQTAALVERANARFGPDGPPADRTQRQDASEGLDWDDLDQEYYAVPDPLAQLLYDFVHANRADIRG